MVTRKQNSNSPRWDERERFQSENGKVVGRTGRHTIVTLIQFNSCTSGLYLNLFPIPNTMPISSILLVEDEPQIRNMLHFTLSRAGFEVHETDTAEDAMVKLDRVLPNIFIIDWMLPGMSGIDLAQRLRANEHTSQLPIIMLTARGEEADRLKGFESGADDYLVKPFSTRELIARIRAVLRRSGASNENLLTAGPISMNLIAHQVSVNGEAVKMGPTEFRLMEHFMRHPDQAFNRTQLVNQVWDRNVYVEERTVDVHVLRLRKALKPFGAHTSIQTVRSIGYRFNAPR